MRTIALRGLWGRKLRTILTGFAIVLGIATISGTFVLTDSITHAFNTIFSSIYVGTDASITGSRVTRWAYIWRAACSTASPGAAVTAGSVISSSAVTDSAFS